MTVKETRHAELVSASENIEAPYELPEGWKWCRLGDFFTHTTGKALKKENTVGSLKKYITTSNIYWNYFDFSDIREMYFTDSELEKCTATKGDLLICNGGDVGRGAIWNFDYDICLQNHVSRLRKKTNNVSTEYFYYIFRFYKDSGLINGKGIGISSLSAKAINELSIPLPPTLAEQERIVKRIETMFAKLDQAQEKAQSVLDSFETRKAAILHKAFTGELTEKWRKEKGVSDESWEKKRLEEVCEKIVCGKTPKEFISVTGDIPYLKVYNISNNKIDFETTPQFIPKGIHEGKLASSILKPYDVVMNIVGPPLRKVAIIPSDYPEWNMNQAIVRFRTLNEVNYKYLYWALINPETLSSVIEETRGVVGQQNISVSQSRGLTIPVPSLPEQQEIVRILDTVLEKESRAKEAAQTVLDQIALLKKSILARAFRGEI